MQTFNTVNRHNLETLSLSIKHILYKGHHIALDTEFTGLGDPKKCRSQNIEDRYLAIRDVVMTHALVSFGLSVFEKDDDEYRVNNMNFVMLCRNPHLCNPMSMSFLVENGFNFNDQIRNGIPYVPGSSVGESNAGLNGIMRSIFEIILTLKKPVALHNGLMDLMFIYHSFYADLPDKLSTFIADVYEMFPVGIYDTKYISDYVTRESVSFLSFLFKKYERMQERVSDGIRIHSQDRIKHDYVLTKKTLAELGLAPSPTTKAFPSSGKPYCEQFAAHGFCNAGKLCKLSHDLDVILSHIEVYGESGNKSKARKRKAPNETEGDSSAEQSLSVVHQDAIVQQAGEFETCHSACFDAYMTGFIFAHQLSAIPNLLQEHGNRLYLIGKSIPLRIEYSRYSRTSEQHQSLKKRIQS